MSGDCDLSLLPVRSDTWVDEPVSIGPVVGPADAVIWATALTNSTNRPTFVTDIVEKVDRESYESFALSSFVVIVLLTYSLCLYENSFHGRRILVNILAKSARVVQHIGELIVDQENLTCTLWSTRFIWLFYTSAISVLVFGYVLSTMSSDLVAAIPMVYIEHISYFLTKKVPDKKPIISKNQFVDSFISQAQQGSELKRLHQLIEQQDGYLSVDWTNTEATLKAQNNLFLKELPDGRAAFIFPELGLRTMMIPCYCAMNPKTVENLHMSEERVAPGNLHYFYSKNLNGYHEQYLSYMIMVAFESHHMYTVMDMMNKEVMKLTNGFVRGSNYYRCVEQKKEESVNSDDIKLYQRSLEHTVLLSQTAIIFATSVWVIELYFKVLFNVFLIQRPLLRAVRKLRRNLMIKFK